MERGVNARVRDTQRERESCKTVQAVPELDQVALGVGKLGHELGQELNQVLSLLLRPQQTDM
jgi:hypothetical protein